MFKKWVFHVHIKRIFEVKVTDLFSKTDFWLVTDGMEGSSLTEEFLKYFAS